MDTTILRLLAHTAAIGLITAIMTVLLIAWYKGWIIRISHIPLALGTLLMFDFWFALLLVSIHDTALVPREILVQILAALEVGAVVLGWSWVLFMLKSNFRFRIRIEAEPSPTI